MRVVSLNLCAYFAPDRIEDLARLVAGYKPDLLLLQEVRRKWLPVVCDITDMDGKHSHDVRPDVSHLPPDGCAIAVRKPLRIADTWRLPPSAFDPSTVKLHIAEPTPPGYEEMPENLACRFSVRNLFAVIEGAGGRFVAASFHATPGESRVHKRGRKVSEWKPFFHGAIAIALADMADPFVFAIDANEPLAETLREVQFHWAAGRDGVRKFEALLGLSPLHRARDLIREAFSEPGRPAEAAEHLALTYTTRGGSKRHFDHLWATPDFQLTDIEIEYKAACDAGTDHTLLVADITRRS